MDYPLTLAVQNFMPVLLSAVAFGWVAAMLRKEDALAGKLALMSVVLIVTGGALKAGWKLLMSLWVLDVPALSQSLFPLIAPGFALLALALWRAQRQAGQGRILAVAAVVLLIEALALGAAFAGVRQWKIPLLTLLTLAMVAAAVLLIGRARLGGDRASAALIALYVIASFGLSGIAVMPQRTLAVEWTEQLVSTAGALALTWAVWRMRRGQRAQRDMVTA